jgi:fatty acid CoA ligase FadD9
MPDMFTRLMQSLVATGIAPGSFYEFDVDGNRQTGALRRTAGRFHRRGDLYAQRTDGGRVRYLPRNDAVRRRYRTRRIRRLAINAGYSVQRIADYGAWLQRSETTLHALPEQQRQASLLPLLHNYQLPEKPTRGTIAPTDRFRAAVQGAKIGPDKDIPHVSPPIIVKYVTNLQLIALL